MIIGFLFEITRRLHRVHLRFQWNICQICRPSGSNNFKYLDGQWCRWLVLRVNQCTWLATSGRPEPVGMDLAINRLTTELDSEMPLDGRALVYFYVKDLRFNFIFIKSIERWIDENFSWSEIDVKNIRGRYTGWQRVDCCVVSGCEVIDELKGIAQRPALGPHFWRRILFVFRFEGRLQEERIVSVFW